MKHDQAAAVYGKKPVPPQALMKPNGL